MKNVNIKNQNGSFKVCLNFALSFSTLIFQFLIYFECEVKILQLRFKALNHRTKSLYQKTS